MTLLENMSSWYYESYLKSGELFLSKKNDLELHRLSLFGVIGPAETRMFVSILLDG